MKPTIANLVKLGSLILGLLGCSLLIHYNYSLLNEIIRFIHEIIMQYKSGSVTTSYTAHLTKTLTFGGEIILIIISAIASFRVLKNPKRSAVIFLLTAMLIFAFEYEHTIPQIASLLLALAGVSALVISLFFSNEDPASLNTQPATSAAAQ